MLSVTLIFAFIIIIIIIIMSYVQIRLWQQRAYKVHEGLGRTSAAINWSSNHRVSVLPRELWSAGITAGGASWSDARSNKTTRTPRGCLSRMSCHSYSRQMLQVSRQRDRNCTGRVWHCCIRLTLLSVRAELILDYIISPKITIAGTNPNPEP